MEERIDALGEVKQELELQRLWIQKLIKAAAGGEVPSAEGDADRVASALGAVASRVEAAIARAGLEVTATRAEHGLTAEGVRAELAAALGRLTEVEAARTELVPRLRDLIDSSEARSAALAERVDEAMDAATGRLAAMEARLSSLPGAQDLAAPIRAEVLAALRSQDVTADARFQTLAATVTRLAERVAEIQTPSAQLERIRDEVSELVRAGEERPAAWMDQVLDAVRSLKDDRPAGELRASFEAATEVLFGRIASVLDRSRADLISATTATQTGIEGAILEVDRASRRRLEAIEAKINESAASAERARLETLDVVEGQGSRTRDLLEQLSADVSAAMSAVTRQAGALESMRAELGGLKDAIGADLASGLRNLGDAMRSRADAHAALLDEMASRAQAAQVSTTAAVHEAAVELRDALTATEGRADDRAGRIEELVEMTRETIGAAEARISNEMSNVSPAAFVKKVEARLELVAILREEIARSSDHLTALSGSLGSIGSRLDSLVEVVAGMREQAKSDRLAVKRVITTAVDGARETLMDAVAGPARSAVAPPKTRKAQGKAASPASVARSRENKGSASKTSAPPRSRKAASPPETGGDRTKKASGQRPPAPSPADGKPGPQPKAVQPVIAPAPTSVTNAPQPSVPRPTRSAPELPDVELELRPSPPPPPPKPETGRPNFDPPRRRRLFGGRRAFEDLHQAVSTTLDQTSQDGRAVRERASVWQLPSASPQVSSLEGRGGPAGAHR